jgi:cytochrome P450
MERTIGGGFVNDSVHSQENERGLTPLEQIDVSRSELYGTDTWRPLFARLRRDAPVHYCADSHVGPFRSVSRFDDIKRVDADNETFSSEWGGVSLIDDEGAGPLQIETFIAMDEPRHSAQRGAVSPAVAPRALSRLEPLIRE